MSVKVMTAVWEHSAHKEGTLVVLLALADCAHDDGSNAFPSVETLAHKARMSPRNVQYCLRRLVDSGEIQWTGKYGKGTNIYRICLERWGATIAGENIAGVQVATSVGCNLRQFGVKPIAPKPSITVSNEPSLPPVVPQTKKTPMTEDWQPSESSLAYAVEWGIASEFVPEVVDDFRAYWLDRPREKRPGWDRSFKNRVRDVADQYRRRARASPNGHAPPVELSPERIAEHQRKARALGYQGEVRELT